MNANFFRFNIIRFPCLICSGNAVDDIEALIDSYSEINVFSSARLEQFACWHWRWMRLFGHSSREVCVHFLPVFSWCWAPISSTCKYMSIEWCCHIKWALLYEPYYCRASTLFWTSWMIVNLVCANYSTGRTSGPFLGSARHLLAVLVPGRMICRNCFLHLPSIAPSSSGTFVRNNPFMSSKVSPSSLSFPISFLVLFSPLNSPWLPFPSILSFLRANETVLSLMH